MAARRDNLAAVSRQISEIFAADSAFMQSTAFGRWKNVGSLALIANFYCFLNDSIMKNVYFELFRLPKCFHSESLSHFQKSQNREPRRYDFIVEPQTHPTQIEQ